MSGSNLQHWVKIGGICLFILLITYGVLSLEARQKKGMGPSRPTTYSTTPGGYKVLYLWVRELGLPFRRWERPFGQLSRSASVLLLVTPEKAVGPGEMKALDRWVREGGTLILAITPPNPLLKRFGMEAVEGRSKGQRDSGRNPVLYQPGPYTQGVQRLLSKGHQGLMAQKPEVVIHARDYYGGLLAVAPWGRGRVIGLADPWILDNESLRKGDHARLALNLLLMHRGKGLLLVDEYHHGYGRASSVLGHLARSKALAPLVQACILLFILWAAAGRRFGLARPDIKTERRSSMEYVKAMARIYQRAQARVLALEGALKWAESEARRLLLDHDRELQHALKAVRQRMKGPQMTDRELLGEVRGLHRALEAARGKTPAEAGNLK